jgi:hypothetical protein
MIEYLDLPSGFSFTLAGVWSFDTLSTAVDLLREAIPPNA